MERVIMRVAVVDDTREDAELLMSALERFGREQNEEMDVTLYDSGASFLRSYEEIRPELVVLDIDMPGINGMEAAHKLRETDENVALLFVTNMRHYALEGYSVDALDYLIKPVEAERFQKAVDKALSYHSLLLKEEKEAIETIVAAEYFFVKAERRYFKVNFSDILFIEGLKDYVILQLNDQRIITRMSLKAIFDLLPKSVFLRVNKSYIVNADHIESFDNNDIFIKSYEIAIGNSYRDDFFEGFVMKQRL